MAFSLPIQEKVLCTWLNAIGIAKTDENIDALAQFIGSSSIHLLKKVLTYAPRNDGKSSQKTIQRIHILAALEKTSIPKRSVQQPSFTLRIPPSSFRKLVRSLVGVLSKTSFRWSSDAMTLLQRSVEWCIKHELGQAKQKSEQYYGDTLEAHAYMQK